MADQSTPTRPRRSAAVEAKVKVEESYEIWGQPPSDNESKRDAHGMKRSATAESPTGRKRRRTTVHDHDIPGTPTILPKTKAEDNASTQPMKRGPAQLKKNPVHQQTPSKVEEHTKKITLTTPNSLTLAEALSQIRDTKESVGHSADSHITDQVVAIGATTDDAVVHFSTRAKWLGDTADVRTRPVPSSIFERSSREQLVLSRGRREHSLTYIQRQVPEILQDDAQNNMSSAETGRIAAGYVEESMGFCAANLDLEGAQLDSEIYSRGDSDHAHLREGQEASDYIREVQRPAPTSSTSALLLIGGHTHPVRKLSSSAVQWASNVKVHDLVMSTFDWTQQSNPKSVRQHSLGDVEAIDRLMFRMEQEMAPAEKARMTIYLDENVSMQQREFLNQYQIHPLVYHFRTEAVVEYFLQKASAGSLEVSNKMPSAIPVQSRVWNKPVLRARSDSSFGHRSSIITETAQPFPGGKSFSNESSPESQPPQGLHRGTPLFSGRTYEDQGWHRLGYTADVTHTTEMAGGAKKANIQGTSSKPPEWQSTSSWRTFQPRNEQVDDNVGGIHDSTHIMPNVRSAAHKSENSADEFVIPHELMSVHPTPMNGQMPNIYVDRYPQGSSVGTHSFDPLVGLPDHSDPRTFHTPNKKDWPHVLAALQPSINHFRQLTDGAYPREMPLDSGYEVAHILLQAHLRAWFVSNRPGYAHKNAIPELFKLDRWEGGIEHWKFASNSPVRPMASARPPGSRSVTQLSKTCLECAQRKVVCSGIQRGGGRRNQCNACSSGGEAFKCSELPKGTKLKPVSPVPQNHPACNGCAHNNVYCHGFQKDIRNRCEPCLKKGQMCSYDMAGFEEPIRI